MEIITREGLTDRPSRRLSWIAIASMAVLSSHVSIRQQDFLNFSNPKSVQNILRWQQVAAYTMLMKNPKNVTLFQAKIPVAIWQQWEAWAKGRGLPSQDHGNLHQNRVKRKLGSFFLGGG